MTTFLFWNIGGKRLEDVIARLVSYYEIDVLILVESSIPTPALLRALQKQKAAYQHCPSLCEKVQIFADFSSRFIKPVHDEDRLTIRHLRLPGQTDVLLAACHFPSKLHWSYQSQAQECTVLAAQIKMVEEQVGHSRTVLVGDLNMNPFEDGVVSAIGLHAVMCRHVAQRHTRIVQSRAYPFFYSPMWSLLGDASPGPSGTYYYAGSEPIVYFWNMFDQVLLRPALLDRFSNQDLEILTSVEETSFLSESGIPGTYASDHLPVRFKLRL